METLNVYFMIINHCADNQCRWSLSQFKMFADKFPIFQITTNCFLIDEENVVNFLHIVAGIKNCRVLIHDPLKSSIVSYRFTLKDVELMVKLDIKVTEIESSMLKMDGKIVTLLKFADLFRQMKHLEDFYFSYGDFEMNPPPMEKLIDIPIRLISLMNFKIQKETIKNVVEILLQMKCLEELYMEANLNEGYKLTVEDFALFQNLPVKTLHLEAFELRKDNIDDFRRIMRGMKIRFINGFRGNLVNRGEDLEISVQRFGPENCYVTI